MLKSFRTSIVRRGLKGCWGPTSTHRHYEIRAYYSELAAPQTDQYTEYMKRKARNKRWGYNVRMVALGVVTVGMVMAIWQPWNQYSKEVSFFLRKALWAEQEGSVDLPKAAENYQKALDQLNTEGMDHLDIRYTGVVLSLAKVFEKMGRIDDERDIYEGVNRFLFPNIVNGNVPEDNKDILVDRDLVVSTRLVTLADKSRMSMALDELLQRLYLCEDRIKEDWPFLAKLGGDLDMDEVIEIDNDSWSYSAHQKRKRFIEKHCSYDAKRFLQQWDPNWPYFMENLVRARDLYAMTEMSKRSDMAIDLLKSNIIMMQLMAKYPIYLGTAISNLGAAYFLKSEKHQSHAADLRKLITSEKDDDSKLQLEMYLKSEQKEQMEALDDSEHIYKKLIERMGGVDKASKSSSQDFKATLCMALYSLGVIELHRGKHKQCEAYFTQAKDIAADNGLVPIMEKIGEEEEKMNMENAMIDLGKN